MFDDENKVPNHSDDSESSNQSEKKEPFTPPVQPNNSAYYTQPQQPPYYGNPSVNAYNSTYAQHRQNVSVRPQRFATKSGVAVAVTIALIFSLILGFGGGFISSRLFSHSGSDGKTVVYEASGSTTNTALTGDSMSIADVVSSVSDTVVQITTESVTTGSIFGQYVSEGAGSGVIISTDGYIITNNHVIDGANKITVTLKDGTEYQAKLVGTDSKTDIAVIKVEANNLKPATLGDSDQLSVGQTAIVIGNPLGSLGGTVTSGIVSALDRDITVNGESMTLLQTSAAVNPGNSGGGLFNANGYLVGVVNAKYTSTDVEGIGFAIPVNIAKSVANDLIQYGYVKGRVDTGFTTVDLTSASAAMSYRVSQTGIYILKVTDASSGFSSGDLIVSMDGTVITKMADYQAVINAHSIGDTIEVVVSRNGRQTTIPMTLKEYVPNNGNTVQQSAYDNIYGWYTG